MTRVKWLKIGNESYKFKEWITRGRKDKIEKLNIDGFQFRSSGCGFNWFVRINS